MVGVVILTATYKNYGITMIFDEVLLDDLDEELPKTVSKVS
jgi:hypothetical protein